MLVNEILNTEIAPLKESDPVSLALAKLDLLHINKFVVVDADHKIKGMISIETLAEVVDESTILTDLPLEEIISVPITQHLSKQPAKCSLMSCTFFRLPTMKIIFLDWFAKEKC